MKLERVTICNFGPFHKEHTIEFQGDGSGVHIIRGNNGQGKTSILRAILWCLYGQVEDRTKKPVPLTSLINKTAQNDDINFFYVEIDFNHEDAKYKLRRSINANGFSQKKYEASMVDSLTINGKPESNSNNNISHQIERIIPRDVSRYFFFDGEMLRDYEELLDESSTNASILRNSIEHILGVPYIRVAKDDLHAILKKTEGERNKILRKTGNKTYEDLAEKSQRVGEAITECESQTQALQSQLDELRVKISEKKREQADLREVKELGERRLNLDLKKAQLEKIRGGHVSSLNELTSNFYKTILSKPASSILASLELKNKLATDKFAKKQRLLGRAEEIQIGINTAKCKACGTVLDPKKLEQFKQDLLEIEEEVKGLTQVPEPNTAYEQYLTTLQNLIDNAPSREDVQSIELKITELDGKIAGINAEISDISAKLGSPDIPEEPKRLEIEIRLMMKEEGRLETAIETLSQDKLGLLEEKSKIEIDMASISRDEFNQLTSRIDLIEKLIKIFDKAIEVYRAEKRENVQTMATDIFKRIRSKEYFSSLSINENFGLSIVTELNSRLDKSEWRSSGEEQLVALSLMGALNKGAQIVAPVMMDTPFSRLDLKHGERVLNFIPSLSEQVILLVTDREFHKGDEVFLADKIKTDLTVIHKGESEGSCIQITRGAA